MTSDRRKCLRPDGIDDHWSPWANLSFDYRGSGHSGRYILIYLALLEKGPFLLGFISRKHLAWSKLDLRISLASKTCPERSSGSVNFLYKSYGINLRVPALSGWPTPNMTVFNEEGGLDALRYHRNGLLQPRHTRSAGRQKPAHCDDDTHCGFTFRACFPIPAIHCTLPLHSLASETPTGSA